MKQLRLILMMVLLCVSVDASVLVIKLDYIDGKFLLNETDLLNSYLPGENKAMSEYRYHLNIISGETIMEGNVAIPGSMIIERDDTNGLPAEIINSRSKKIIIYLNYTPKVKDFGIFDDSGLVFSLNLMEYNKCNINSVCESQENKFYCPEDCSSIPKDGVCISVEDGICSTDQDCTVPDRDCVVAEIKENKEAQRESQDDPEPIKKAAGHENIQTMDIVAILVILVIMIILFIIFIMRAIKKNKI